MPDWDKELEEIFKDPIFDDVKAPKRRPSSSDKLVDNFNEIVRFFEENGRLPEKSKTDQAERKLFNQLQGILKDTSKIEHCRPYDTAGILPAHVPTTDEQIDDILNDPLFADLDEAASLFDVPEYMKQKLAERQEADYVGKRVPCQDFDQFEAGFREIHAGLKSGKYRLVKFSEASFIPGHYYVEDGMVLYFAAWSDMMKNRQGRTDGRTRIIYDNGLESDVKYRTMTKNLCVTGYTVQNTEDMTPEEFEEQFTVTDKDVESGIVYVLRSLSTDPEIASVKDLYKIGFTTTTVESRIAHAKDEPTYLCAPVEIVATWRVYNVKSSIFENLIHKLFDSVKFNVIVNNNRPKEWFVVPLPIIKQAVLDIVNGVPVAYDHHIQQLIMLQSHTGMKCLSVRQPWASLICSGLKDVENRSWKPKKAPGRILIHAGATTEKIDISGIEAQFGVSLGKLPNSAIIGYVEVYGFTEHSDSIWAGDGHGAEWKWLLRNAKFFKEPIPYKGRLGLFNVPEIDPNNLPATK